MTAPQNTQKRAVIIGLGYVGLPLAVRAAEVGWQVVGLDLDKRRVDELNAGRSYVEDISDEQVASWTSSGALLASTSYADAANFDVAVISVPTPLREGLPDLTFIEDSGRALAALVRPGCTVILESTTYPGTTEELLRPILESGSGLEAGTDFHLGYSPERIDPGNQRYTLTNTPKIVSGLTPACLAKVQGFYDEFIDRTVPVTACRTAELSKLLENTFRHVNIALVNELAMFAHDLGIDIWEAIDASASKPFGFMKFTPGPGVGGHCLPIDPSYLSWDVKRRLGMPFRFVDLANDINEHMPDYVVKRVFSLLNDRCQTVRGSKIVLVGLSYKKNSGDVRESPATSVAKRLLALGAQVSYLDPMVADHDVRIDIRRVEDVEADLVGCDLVVILTDHDELDYDLVAKAPVILDCRRRMPAAPNVQLL